MRAQVHRCSRDVRERGEQAMASPSHEQRLHHDVLRLLVFVQGLVEVRRLTGIRGERRRVHAHAHILGLELRRQPILQAGVVGAQEDAGAVPRHALRQDSRGQVLVRQLEIGLRLDGLIPAADVHREPATATREQALGRQAELPQERLLQRDGPLHQRAPLLRLLQRDAAVSLDDATEGAEDNLVLIRLDEVPVAKERLQHLGRHRELRRLAEDGRPKVRLAGRASVEQVLPGPIHDQGPTVLLTRHSVPQGQGEHGK
mmetsp:Transcript_43791/g.126501  ORF Transcript_43791/g.126501 Transcript_43791/m.126501 type:complete len:258 (-) Transcript_43791:839-1612(-)